MSPRLSRVLHGVVLLLLAMACMPALVPTAAPLPTFDPNSINTAIVQTADAAATQTALVVSSTPTSTATPEATHTASITPTATVTFIFILSTPTVPSNTPEPRMSNQQFSCQVLSKNPTDDSHQSPNASFEMTWTVMNNGTSNWDSNSVDYRFKSGSKLHKAQAYDLESSVPSGGQANITVQMKAPEAAGTYSTTWVIRSGPSEFCRMGVTIKVP